MAPAKKQSKGAITARIQANAAWGSLRSVDAPPKPISEGVEPETLGMEIFTPIAVQNERGAPNLSPASYQHCQFCADISMDLFTCIKCEKKVCAALKQGGTGCVIKDTIPKEMVNAFKCPDCHEGPMYAWFQGYAFRGKDRKVLWPAAIFTASLYSTDDGYYASRRIQLDAEHHYRHATHNLRVTHLTMRGNSQIFQRKLVEPTTKFLEQAMEAYIPANLVIFIDTHSDANTGYLQYSGGKSGGNSAAIDELLREFIGPKFFELVAKNTKLATDLRKNEQAFRAAYPQYDGPVLGGMRVLVMMSCGPTMTKEGHLMRVTKLIAESDMFDLVIGFSGEGTLPEHVMNDLLELIRCITTNCTRDIWTLLNSTFKHSEKILHHSPLVAIFRDNGSVRKIEFGLHEPPTRVLGVKVWCGSPSGVCNPGPGDLTYKNNHSGTGKETVRQKCCRCGYVSPWIALKDVTWVHLLPGSRRVYWHDYPITPQQQMLFTPVADARSSHARVDQQNQSKKRQRGLSSHAQVDQQDQSKKRQRGISAIGVQATKKRK